MAPTVALLSVLKTHIVEAVRLAGINAAFHGPGALGLPNVRLWLERQLAAIGVDVSAWCTLSASMLLSRRTSRGLIGVRTCSMTQLSSCAVACGGEVNCASPRGPTCS